MELIKKPLFDDNKHFDTLIRLIHRSVLIITTFRGSYFPPCETFESYILFLNTQFFGTPAFVLYGVLLSSSSPIIRISINFVFFS